MTSKSAPAPFPGKMGKIEFIALMAMLMALNSLAIDILLPALQNIGTTFHVEDANNRQYVVTAYLIGFGVLQLLYGPLSDRFGRKIPLLGGLGIYIIAALASTAAPSFEIFLILRFLQGAGAAATRVIVFSIVRDCYDGRAMGEISSMIGMVFMVVPVIAPEIGQIILFAGDWHLVSIIMTLGGILMFAWVALRLPESLAKENVRHIDLASVANGFKSVLTNRITLFYTLATTVIFGGLFGFINSAQQVYDGVYGLGAFFPLAFAASATAMSLASLLNAKIVGRYGMRRLSHLALLGFSGTTVIWLLIQLSTTGPMNLVLFITLFSIIMFQFGAIGSNFNTMAMEPLGQVAGTASAVLGFSGTVGGSLIGAMIGQAFNGTAVPLMVSFVSVSFFSLIFVLIAEKGKLFRPHNEP